MIVFAYKTSVDIDILTSRTMTDQELVNNARKKIAALLALPNEELLERVRDGLVVVSEDASIFDVPVIETVTRDDERVYKVIARSEAEARELVGDYRDDLFVNKGDSPERVVHRKPKV